MKARRKFSASLEQNFSNFFSKIVDIPLIEWYNRYVIKEGPRAGQAAGHRR